MAWWLVDSIINGTLDEDYPIMSKDEVTVLGGSGEDTISFSSDGIHAADTVAFEGFSGSDLHPLTGGPESDQSWWKDDGFSLVGNPFSAGSSQDTLNLGVLPGGMGEDHISLGGTAWRDNKYYADGYDPYPTNGDPYPTLGAGVDTLNLSTKPQPNLKGPSNQKYQEDKGIKDLKDYVSSTYQGHYTNDNSDVQTLDLIHSVGDAESFCRSNALKYLSRYDKKGQAKRDILKAMHYCLLLYYFSGNTNDEITTRGYETF